MLRSRSGTEKPQRGQSVVVISPYTPVKQPGPILPSQRLASFQNQQLGAATQGLKRPTLGSSSPGSAFGASVGRTEPVSVVQKSSMNIMRGVKEGNARLAALQKAAAPKVQRANPVGQQGQYKNYSGGFKPSGGRYPAGQIDVSQTVKVGNAYLRKDAGQAFMQMAQAFRSATGKQLGITEGWRSYDRQVKLYNDYRNGRGNLAAKPGTSTHGKGTAVDMNGMGALGSASFRWLQQNAPKFGYSWTGGTFSQIEPWHWDYRG